MCKEIKIILAVFIFLFTLRISSFSVDKPSISASSAVLIVYGTNEVLYEKDAYSQRPMASTTKIMSSILALESGKIDDEIVVTNEMITVEGTSMGLKAGDSVSLRELVYGMLLSSGNDAANTTAYMVGGNIESFVFMMNDKAKQIGMNFTHFSTPSGLDADDHYSTAYDMAILGAYALNNLDFREICSKYSATIDYGNPPYSRRLINHNKLLKYCDGTIGIKTGFTKKSGRCLVSAVERNGITLICVTLNDPNDWDDHKKLFEYGFGVVKKYQSKNTEFSIELVGEENSTVNAILQYEPSIYTNNESLITQKIVIEHFLYPPIVKNDIVGYVEFYYPNGRLAEKIPLIVNSNVENNTRETKSESYFERIIRALKGEKND